ncbi:VCBS repeat-containing protein [Winogradskyella sp. F6397]|uniref:VCBS repeat-containing protein n=1 Tax=Winogradskyella marina TaxID=2785530 RepID=A0ABS0EJF2_9FLAO|nr:VCBS repeat-containing protein [Winogradskyella marina]MBF8150590.1 VCBS repeat-containing protein [Winogradskyella marina]
MKFIKTVLKLLSIAVVLVLLFIVVFFYHDSVSDKYDISISDKDIPTFSPIPLDFVHQYHGEKSLPIAPSALIDINNDTVDEVFFGGGMLQEDAIFAYRNNAFVDISTEVNLPKKGNSSTTVGAVSADFDNNGFTDLILSREDGLHLYYNTNGRFTEVLIDTPVNAKSNPAGITVADIDKDGDLDIFLATYLKKELMEGQNIFEDYNYGSTSELLLNNGDNTFKSITKAAGLDYVHNTFQGVFVDIDNDTWQDLVVVHDTGEVRTYKNNGDLTFTMKANPMTKRFAYPMGLAVGDYNNDGWVDFMFSNTGSTLPNKIARGDIKNTSLFIDKWMLFENQGDFKFTDVAATAKIADYEFAWGCTFADLNNDGLQDLMVAENYVDFPPSKLFTLPSRVLIQKNDGTFAPTEDKSGLVNPYYGITSLVSDFNQDGYLDMIWVNIDTPSLAYINKGGTHNYLQVDLGESIQVQGAKVTVTTPTKTLTDWLVSGEGLASDQTALLQFGLGDETTISNVTIWLTNDEVISIDTPIINSVISLTAELEKQNALLESAEAIEE